MVPFHSHSARDLLVRSDMPLAWNNSPGRWYKLFSFLACFSFNPSKILGTLFHKPVEVRRCTCFCQRYDPCFYRCPGLLLLRKGSVPISRLDLTGKKSLLHSLTRFPERCRPFVLFCPLPSVQRRRDTVSVQVQALVHGSSDSLLLLL